MQKYAVGECVDGFKTYQEGVHFDVTDAGAQLVILFNGPTPKEIDAVRKGRSSQMDGCSLQRTFVQGPNEATGATERTRLWVHDNPC